MKPEFSPRKRKVHLFRDNRDEKFSNGKPGVMANTLCRGNFHNYTTTEDYRKVSCSGCRALIAKGKHLDRKIDGSDPLIPRQKLVELADLIRNSHRLQAERSLTIAKMIETCLDQILADPNARLRGHEPWLRRSEILAENRKRRVEAIQGLRDLIVMLRNASTELTPSSEGESNVSRSS